MWGRVVVLVGMGLAATPSFAVDAGRAAIEDCDRLAANPFDKDRPPAIPGVKDGDFDDEKMMISVCRLAVTAASKIAGPQAVADLRRVQFELGRALESNSDKTSGKEAEQSRSEAKSLYEKAVAAGSAAAMASLGHMLSLVDGAASIKLLQKSAEAGNANGMFWLGIQYDTGFTANQDYKLAKYWYEKAAEGGSEKAMVGLYEIYENGRGVTANKTAARIWLEKAAAAGDGFAQAMIER